MQRTVQRLLAFLFMLPLWLIPFDSARADQHRVYSQEALDALQADDQPVLIDVYAPWCPTCQRQQVVLDALLKEPDFQGYRVLRLDWDAQRLDARRLGAPRQSTLLIFRGGKKVSMSVAETREAPLRDFLLLGTK